MVIDPREVINGCDVFDREHEVLVLLINAIYKLVKEGRREEAKKLLEEGLYEYTERHLKHEEEVMERFGYPHLESHKRAHQTFRKIVYENFKNLEDEKSFVENASFAIGWILSHIRKSDKRYAQYFKEKNLKACEESPVKLGIEEKLKEILK